MTASLTENSFPSTRCHYELNVSSTWWMDFSAKIYFDQVSALCCLTPWLSPFLPPSATVFQVLSFCQATSLHRRLFFLSYSRQAWCLAVICELEPWAMCFRVSEWVCVCACATLIPGLSQSDGQAEWLIGARQSDLRQGEHTQSYSSRSNSSTITGALVWVMLYRLPCMRGQEQRRGWFDTQIHLGSHCYYMLQEK